MQIRPITLRYKIPDLVPNGICKWLVAAVVSARESWRTFFPECWPYCAGFFVSTFICLFILSLLRLWFSGIEQTLSRTAGLPQLLMYASEYRAPSGTPKVQFKRSTRTLSPSAKRRNIQAAKVWILYWFLSRLSFSSNTKQTNSTEWVLLSLSWKLRRTFHFAISNNWSFRFKFLIN